MASPSFSDTYFRTLSNSLSRARTHKLSLSLSLSNSHQPLFLKISLSLSLSLSSTLNTAPTHVYLPRVLERRTRWYKPVTTCEHYIHLLLVTSSQHTTTYWITHKLVHEEIIEEDTLNWQKSEIVEREGESQTQTQTQTQTHRPPNRYTGVVRGT
jgi:hypothetical protein